jgi:hypothetical protein
VIPVFPPPCLTLETKYLTRNRYLQLEMKEYHYVYQITFEEVPHIYFGSRTCECLPEKDINYLGSPVTFKSYWELYTPIKTILSFNFLTKADAIIYENNLIRGQWDKNKSLSLNATISNEKFHMRGGKRSKESCKKTGDAHAGYYYLISPLGEIFEGYNVSEFCREQNLCATNCCQVMKLKHFHSDGWTASLRIHKFYIERHKVRGISWNKSKEKWQVKWTFNGERKCRCFKEKQNAIIFRDFLVSNGCKIKVACKDWKLMLDDSHTTAA